MIPGGLPSLFEPASINPAAFIMVLGLLFLGAVPSTAQSCEYNDELGTFVDETYAAPIRFEVLRNGKPVGEHETRFMNADKGLRVESRMTLSVKVLFFTAYEFEYRSVSEFCGDRMVTLDAYVNDGGEERYTRAGLENGELVIRHGEREARAHPGLLTTDHWNPRVLHTQRVLNTLTGRINDVRFAPCETTLLAPKDATCHAYTGDLDARVWYDARGAWVGLEFEGRDGSDITYRCTNCEHTGA